MKKIIILLIFFLNFISLQEAKQAFAIYNPLLLPNNKYGIHIINQEDIDDVIELVNTNGDWGYVTFVIRKDQRNLDEWRPFFEKLKKNHLIPIVRIATIIEGSFWKKPEINDLNDWSDFLDKLPWPTKNRYIVIYNEPNHANEWGDEIDPFLYAEILDKALDIFTEKNEHFFVLSAGFDLAAINAKKTVEVTRFWEQMEQKKPGIFKKLKGWVSHSYPNPHFSASPYKEGRLSIKGYSWELDYLSKNYSLDKKIPVFITETGWAQNRQLNPATISEFYKIAFSQAWDDSQIVAITPFILNYTHGDFSKFSWKAKNGDYYSHYYSIQNMEKISAQPLYNPESPFGEILINLLEKQYLKNDVTAQYAFLNNINPYNLKY